MTRNPAKPDTNLFRYATKELSQDAVICWLIAWSGQGKSNDPEEEELRRCGREFVHALLNHRRKEKPVELPEEIETEIHPQEKHIDVLALINGKYVLLIEDKTGSGDHSGQLKRYYNLVADGNTKLGETAPENIYPIYFKTGNQSLWDDQRIENKIKIEGPNNYRVFHRKDFLRMLDDYKGKNQILMDYKQYLQDVEAATNGYKNWSKDSKKSSGEAWQGFYHCIEGYIDGSKWGYVHNQSGGFLCFSWAPPVEVGWLQIESHNQELRFKVWEDEKEKWKDTRTKWYRLIMAAGKEQVRKPTRFGNGKHMAVAVWKDWMAFRQDGKLDISGTVKNLKEAESVLKKAQLEKPYAV